MKGILLSFLLVVSSVSYAQMKKNQWAGCLDCFNFVAPTILGAENVNPAEVGLIVYDSYYNMFRGYNSGGVWSKISNEKINRTITASTTLTVVDEFVKVDASSGAVTLNLPSAASMSGKEIIIKKIDSSSNTVTVDPYSTETVDGNGTVATKFQNDLFRLVSDGTNWQHIFSKKPVAPTIQKFTSSCSTYTTPVGVTYLKVKAVGGGGGGGASGASPGTAGNGGATTFGSLVTANGGSLGGNGGTPGGAGGTASISSVSGTAIDGGTGHAGSWDINGEGGPGAGSVLAGAGAAGVRGGTGGTARLNSGSGGGGAGGNASYAAGSGGGAGAYVEVIVPNPASSYSCALGAGASGASAGSGGYAGGNGAAGYIEVTEYYQ